MGRQRRQSTKTDDPDRALREKLKFLDQQKQKPEEIEARTENLGKLPLNKAADLYFQLEVGEELHDNDSAGAITIRPFSDSPCSTAPSEWLNCCRRSLIIRKIKFVSPPGS